jgi:hypothetical protein
MFLYVLTLFSQEARKHEPIQTRARQPNNAHANPITDRTRPTWTPEAFRARSLELLATQYIVWSHCRRLAQGFDLAGRLVWVEIAVPSTAVARAMYFVRYEVLSDKASCDCTLGQLGQPCFHAGAAIAHGRTATAQLRA